MAALTDFAFRRLAARRLEIRCDPDNKPAAALPQRLGYRLEQIIPRARHNHDSGEWRDVAAFWVPPIFVRKCAIESVS
ncbi:MAG TPA: GNAT family protein [Anaerolineae bacterium]